jgi:hypothetical protein
LRIVYANLLAFVFVAGSCGVCYAGDPSQAALTTFLSSSSVDKDLFVEHFFDSVPKSQAQNILDQLHAVGGKFLLVERHGGAYLARYNNGIAPFEVILDPHDLILGLWSVGWIPKGHDLPTGLDDDLAISQTLSKIFNSPSVDLSLFVDAALATKVSNNRDVLVQPLGQFRGVVADRGSFFARFATMQLPIFVYVNASGKIQSLWIYPAIPITATMAQ